MDEKELQDMLLEDREFWKKAVNSALVIASVFVGIRLAEAVIRFVDVGMKHW